VMTALYVEADVSYPLINARRSVDVADDFTAAGRVADVNRVFEVEGFCDLGDIGRIRVHVVAVGRLGRPSMPPAIVGDDPVALFNEKHHL